MFNNPYNQTPLYNPMGQQPNLFTQYFGNLLAQQQQPWKILQVKGKAGANAVEMPSGSEALFMDEIDPIIWYVRTDDGGTKTVTGLDISIHEDEEQKTMASLEERIRKLEEEMKKRHEPDYVDVAYTE